MRSMTRCRRTLTPVNASPLVAELVVLYIVLLEVTELTAGVKGGLSVFEARLLSRSSPPVRPLPPGACVRLGSRHPVLP